VVPCSDKPKQLLPNSSTRRVPVWSTQSINHSINQSLNQGSKSTSRWSGIVLQHCNEFWCVRVAEIHLRGTTGRENAKQAYTIRNNRACKPAVALQRTKCFVLCEKRVPLYFKPLLPQTSRPCVSCRSVLLVFDLSIADPYVAVSL
jgi:hypothetical protein